MGWLLDVAAGVASTVATAALAVTAREVRLFFRWVRRQADLVDGIDLAGSRMVSTASVLEVTAARLERATQNLARMDRR